jgi:hypothetical protein
MQPYVIEALAAERVRSLHEEAAARRLARAGRGGRRAAGLPWWARRLAPAARPAAEPTCKPAT